MKPEDFANAILDVVEETSCQAALAPSRVIDRVIDAGEEVCKKTDSFFDKILGFR